MELFFRDIHPKQPVFVCSWRDEEETDEEEAGPFGIAGDFRAQPSTAGVLLHVGGGPPASASVIPSLEIRRGLDEPGHDDDDASGTVTLPPQTSCLSNVTRLLVLHEPPPPTVAATAADTATSVPS